MKFPSKVSRCLLRKLSKDRSGSKITRNQKGKYGELAHRKRYKQLCTMKMNQRIMERLQKRKIESRKNKVIRNKKLLKK